MIYKSKINPTCESCEKADTCKWVDRMEHIKQKLDEINDRLVETPIDVESYCKSYWQKPTVRSIR